MAGGLLNIVSYGSCSILVFGNPKKSIFHKTYKSITNFGMQKFRLEPEGNSTLSHDVETTFSFKIERHADLLGDVYLLFNLPEVHDETREFKWIKEIGVYAINDIEFSSGGQVLSKYSGEYLSMISHRDNFKNRKLWEKMIGHVPEMYDPKNAFNRTEHPTKHRSRKLCIPLELFFCRGSHNALPLTAIEYSELYIKIRIKPFKELYCIKKDEDNNYIKNTGSNIYFNANWNHDIHLIANYYYLSKDENIEITKRNHNFLIKDVIQHNMNGLFGSCTSRINLKSLVSSLVFRFRRSDSSERNEWDNYTNWKYSNTFESDNRENIMEKLSIILDGKIREENLEKEIFEYIEPYARSNFIGKDGLYFYNFTTNTDVYNHQPLGGMNMDKFENIEFNFTLFTPEFDKEYTGQNICDPFDNEQIGVTRIIEKVFKYTYDLLMFEERYNVIQIKSGIIGMLYAR